MSHNPTIADCLDEIRRLTAENERLSDQLRASANYLSRLEVITKTASTFADEADCVACGSTKDAGDGKFQHAEDCWLRDLLQLGGTGEPG